MSDDLVKWLDDLAAVEGEPTATVLKKAADRIEKLEAALREITTKDLFGMDWAIRTARTALEGKDD